MVFWLTGFLLSVAIVVLFAAVLMRKVAAPEVDAEREVEFYKSQLAEVDTEQSRGHIGDDDAEQTRREVSRRLLRAHGKAERTASDSTTPSRLSTSLVIAAIVVLLLPVAFAIHWQIGSPTVPDMPLQKRFQVAEEARKSRPTQSEWIANLPDTTTITEDPESAMLVDDFRKKLSGQNIGIEELRLLVRLETSLQNYGAAIQAQQQIIAILGNTVSAFEYSELADLLAVQANGYVSPEAEEAVLMALQLDQSDTVARYYLGLMFSQTGRLDRTVKIWSDLYSGVSDDSPIFEDLQFSLPAAATISGIKVDLTTLRPLPGPDAEMIAEAEAMTVDDRNEFIEGMVTSLRERLFDEGGTPAEWSRLIRSQMVLGDSESATDSFERAKVEFGNDPNIIQSIIESSGIQITE